MLVGQQLGPFKIDKELGTGAMGAVYRGIYPKTGQKVAIKIMAPGLAADSRALARFEREAAILKQFKHPNIVRLFAVGKHQGMRYYAMEYIEGESLDRVMARRGRMTWEEVVTLGQQLCAALQHAHEKGIVHRDLKPSNLMLLPDGTLKLTDFGIAKDLDVTQLTEANCTVGTAAYMSPEQCKGERDLTHKSDLYSLGVVFYELLIGRKPFSADNAMEMFLQHVQGKFERPSRIVLDIPVWLDNLVCQLLEKKPDQRPFDADMVSNALGSIAEKVEAQQSAGVDAARRRRIDRPSGDQVQTDETDKETARTLLGKTKPKGKKKSLRRKRFYETVWFQAAGLGSLLLAVIVTLYLLFQPPSAEKLYLQAQKLMQSSDPEDWDKALKGPIKSYQAHYANLPGAQTQQMRDWVVAIEIAQNERLLRNYIQKKKGPLKVQYQSDAEKEGFAAIDAEEEGDLKKTKELWQAMVKKYGEGSGYTRWGQLAENHLKVLEGIEAQEKNLKAKYDKVALLGGDPAMNSELEAEFFLAFRYEWFGDVYKAHLRFKDLEEKTLDKPDQRAWYLMANFKERELQGKLRDNPSLEKDRLALVEKKLAQANQSKDRDEARGICKNIVVLYGKEAGMEKPVEAAESRLAQLQ